MQRKVKVITCTFLSVTSGGERSNSKGLDYRLGNELASLQSKVEVWGNGGLTDPLLGLRHWIGKTRQTIK